MRCLDCHVTCATALELASHKADEHFLALICKICHDTFRDRAVAKEHVMKTHLNFENTEQKSEDKGKMTVVESEAAVAAKPKRRSEPCPKRFKEGGAELPKLPVLVEGSVESLSKVDNGTFNQKSLKRQNETNLMEVPAKKAKAPETPKESIKQEGTTLKKIKREGVKESRKEDPASESVLNPIILPEDTRGKNGMHQCNYCDTEFYLKVYLKQHIAIEHYNRSRVMCHAEATCQRSFNKPSHLRDHIVVAHMSVTVDPLKVLMTCEHCPKKFQKPCHKQVSHYVSNHMRQLKDLEASTHLRNKIGSYNCASCSESFCFPELLEAHQVKWHSPNNMGCPYCQDRVSGSKLALHVISQHMTETLAGVQGLVRGKDVCWVCKLPLEGEFESARHMLERHEAEVHTVLNMAVESAVGQESEEMTILPC